MNTENEHEYFRVEVIGESDKALCVRLQRDGAEYWVPRSLCELRQNGVLEVEAWFANKEGMND